MILPHPSPDADADTDAALSDDRGGAGGGSSLDFESANTFAASVLRARAQLPTDGGASSGVRADDDGGGGFGNAAPKTGEGSVGGSSVATSREASPPPPPAPHAAAAGFGAGEADKFELFERWLRDNGARFSQLELRKYSSSSSSRVGGDDSDDDDSSGDGRSMAESEEDDNEEKKEPNEDGGEAQGVASMSLDGGGCGDKSKEKAAKGGAKGKERSDGTEDDDGSDEMRGVHAKTTIPPQTVCVSIPKQCLITVEMGQATPIGRKILASDLDLDAPKHIFLMIFLLWDRKVRGPSSFFAPYYSILPAKLRNMPVFWTDEELDMLAGSHLLAQIADRADAIAEDYASIRRVAPELASIATLAEFQWARMIVCSRNFGLLIDGRRTSALVPHADMLNHYRPRETKWTFDDESQCFTITTLQAIGAGCQVYDSYGQKCNHRFLLNYGFAVEDNREIDDFCPNEVPLELGVELGRSSGGGGDRDRDAECFERKAAFWSRGEAGGGGSGAPHHNYRGAGHHHHLGSSYEALSVALAAGGSAVGGGGTNASAAVAVAGAVMCDPAAALAPPAVACRGTAVSDHPAGPPPPPPIKRVRVCASNNENTRILFSMLRLLACDAHELDHVTGADLPSPFEPTTVSQRLFGLTASGQTFSSALSAVSQAAMRTCRDIRHPLTFRNERRAMEILLDVTARALARYPTSLSRDEANLLDEEAYPRYSNKRHAKLQVRGEKEVLHHFALWARTAIHVVDIILHELAAEKRSLLGGGGGGEPSSKGEGGTSIGGTNGGSGDDNIGFDYVIQAMEDDEDCHPTILRYCSDVLGAARHARGMGFDQ